MAFDFQHGPRNHLGTCRVAIACTLLSLLVTHIPLPRSPQVSPVRSTISCGASHNKQQCLIEDFAPSPALAQTFLPSPNIVPYRLLTAESGPSTSRPKGPHYNRPPPQRLTAA